jgi:hypothetical protein
MLTLLLAAVLAILGFLCFTGPGGVNGAGRNSAAKRRESRMTLKAKRNEILELPAIPNELLTANTSSNGAPNDEEIRRRAYEIYLERDGRSRNELDDWFQAEAELRSNAFVTRTTKETG